MARGGIAARAFAPSHAVVDVPPMILRNLARVDARRLDRVDEAEDLRDLGPAPDREEEITARIDLRNRCARFVRRDSTHNVERRADPSRVD